MFFGFLIALLGSSSVPHQRFCAVLNNAVSMLIERSKVYLGNGIILLSRFPKPF